MRGMCFISSRAIRVNIEPARGGETLGSSLALLAHAYRLARKVLQVSSFLSPSDQRLHPLLPPTRYTLKQEESDSLAFTEQLDSENSSLPFTRAID